MSFIPLQLAHWFMLAFSRGTFEARICSVLLEYDVVIKDFLDIAFSKLLVILSCRNQAEYHVLS